MSHQLLHTGKWTGEVNDQYFWFYFYGFKINGLCSSKVCFYETVHCAVRVDWYMYMFVIKS